MRKRRSINKTGLIRELVHNGAQKGMRPWEIRDAVSGKMSAKYVYNALAKLKAKGEITSSGGAYFPSPSLNIEDNALPNGPDGGSNSSGNLSGASGKPKHGLVQELATLKRNFDEYTRGYRDGWLASLKSRKNGRRS